MMRDPSSDNPDEHAPDSNPGSGAPLYLQVATTLRMAILRGIYPVGSRMPTESALCRRFGISRYTVREALRQLRNEGLINSTPGSRPTVARQAPRRSEISADEFGKDFFDYSIGTRLEIASMDMGPLPPDLAASAALPAEEDWLCVAAYRIGVDDRTPTCWNEYFIRAEYALVGRLLPRHIGPIIPLLEDLFEEPLTRMTRIVDAVAMPEERAARLGSLSGGPALRILVRCQTAAGKTAMLHRSVHPSGALTYIIQR